MNDELQAIQTAQESGDHDSAVHLSDAYVAANPNAFVDMASKNVEELVSAIDVFREAGMDENLWQVQAWLYHHYEPQKIGGAQDATVRVV